MTKPIHVRWSNSQGEPCELKLRDDRGGAIEVAVDGQTFVVNGDAHDMQTSVKLAENGDEVVAANDHVVLSPMPGVVARVLVKAGQSVKAGDPLIVLMAMKMENEICANGDGVVQSIKVSDGSIVQTGAVLLVIG